MGIMTASAQAGTLASLSVQQATPYDEYIESVEHQKEPLPSTEDFALQQPLQADPSPSLVVQQTLSAEAPHASSLAAIRSNDEVIIKSEAPPAPERVEVPEPSVVVGLVAVAGLIAFKRQRILT